MMLWGVISILAVSLLCRIFFQIREKREEADGRDGLCRTTGNCEVQADAAESVVTSAGKLAVLADGIGRENTGKVCANLAVQEFKEAFLAYRTLHNPKYFFERTMYGVHKNIQRVLEERCGGASVGVVFLADGLLYYGLAGQVKIAILRGEELIPLCEGQTIGALAQRAYQDGKLGRQETIWAMEDKQVWNYAGRDGFCQMEVCEVPVRLKSGDLVVMMTKGVFEEVSFSEMEKILSARLLTAQEKAEKIVRKAEKSPAKDKENGSILVLQTDGAMR